MSPQTDTAAQVPDESLEETLRQVHALDPQSSAEAVRRFLREIAEAAAALDAVQLDDREGPTPFSARWEEVDA